VLINASIVTALLILQIF